MLGGETAMREAFDNGQVVPLSAYLHSPSPRGQGYPHQYPEGAPPAFSRTFSNPAYPPYRTLDPSPFSANGMSSDQRNFSSSTGSAATPHWTGQAHVSYSEPIVRGQHVLPPLDLLRDHCSTEPLNSTCSSGSNASWQGLSTAPQRNGPEEYPAERYHLGQVRVPAVHETPVYQNQAPLYAPYRLAHFQSKAPTSYDTLSRTDSLQSFSYGSSGIAALQSQLSAASSGASPPVSGGHPDASQVRKMPSQRSLIERRGGEQGFGKMPAPERRSFDSMAVQTSSGLSLKDELALMDSDDGGGAWGGLCSSKTGEEEGVPRMSKGVAGPRSFPGPQTYQPGKREEPSRHLPLSAATAECRIFSAQALASSTDNWHGKNALGNGRFGTVFLGRISGCQVAVKRLESTSKSSAKEYQSEVEVLSRVRHPNIILLMGHCPEASCLVYEFMPGGSLQDYLGPTNDAHARPPLQWAQRVQVIADVASALLCLHQFSPPVVHRDLKPHNIMLDSNLRAKVGDAGLARLLEDEEDSITCRVSGTFGYIDPEMMTSLEVTPTNDVYAFGIIILQLLTGECQVAKIHKVINETMASVPEKLVQQKVVEELMSRLDRTAGTWPLAVARELARLGLRCASRTSRDRPYLEEEVMPTLADMLEGAAAAQGYNENATVAAAVAAAADAETQFLCPLSKKRMTDPVLAADGFTYERQTIETWQGSHDWSPVTGQGFEHKALLPNNSLKMLLARPRAACV